MKDYTVLGFDFGLRSIGLAIGQTVTVSASALPALKAQNGQPDWEHLARVVDTWRPELFIVGDPMNMDGTVSKTGKQAKQFAKQLQKKFSLQVHMVDERLTTQEARMRLPENRGGYWKNKQKIDSVAAKVIVEQWLKSYVKNN